MKKKNVINFIFYFCVFLIILIIITLGRMFHSHSPHAVLIFSFVMASIPLNIFMLYKWRNVQNLNVAFKNTQIELSKSEHKYRTLVESIIEGIGIVDDDENINYFNKAAHDIFGYENGTMIGKNLKEFTSEDTFNLIQDKTNQRKQGNTDIYEIEILRSDNTPRTILLKSSPMTDKNGNYKGSFGIFRDITEQKIEATKREQLISELENKVNHYNTIPKGVIPICASCSHIRDENNDGKAAADYLSEVTDLKFSHTICPQCKEELYSK